MAKVTLGTLSSLANQTSAITTINSNSTLLETAIENTLSRDGTTPNAMGASLDMNSNRILNLPIPESDSEPLRLIDITLLEISDTIVALGSTTNNAIVKWVGTGATQIANSGVTIDSSNNVITPAAVNSATLVTTAGATIGTSLAVGTNETVAGNLTVSGVITQGTLPIRERLTGTRNYYVSTTGSDSNTGLDISHPFATIQKAIDVVSYNLDLNAQSVVINLSGGTYTETLLLREYLGRGTQGHNTPIIQGISPGAGGYAITSASAGATITGVSCGGKEWTLKNLTVNNTNSGQCVLADKGSWVCIDTIQLGGTPTTHLVAENEGLLEIVGPVTISSPAAIFMTAILGGEIVDTGNLITTNGATFSSCFAYADYYGLMTLTGMTFSAPTVGPRFIMSNGGQIRTDGTDPNSFLPGSSNGTYGGINTALLSYNTGGIGYAAGAGGSVTQSTNRSTGVTLNKTTGAITTNSASLAAAAQATFTVTNSTVAINDVVLLSIRSGQTNKETRATVTAVTAGTFDITVMNQHAATAETGSIVINFSVIKGAVS